MSEDVLVKVENVSKRFCRSLKRSLWYGLQDLGSEIGGRRHGGGSGLPRSSADVQLRPDEFWAVKDVSFELRRGECLGLIGRNGAGKTTLLRMLNGLIKPDAGRIEMKGNVGALIALGAGFNPILTGRENIQITCGILGIGGNQLMDSIIEFSELNEYIDMPVQTYSSGMAVRLGFAANIMIEPDILILDEVLAVGDASFRSKCYQKIQDINSRAATILVSHDAGQLQKVCSHGLLLSRQCSHGKTDLSDALVEYERLKLVDPSNASIAIDRKNCNITDYNIKIEPGEDGDLSIAATLQSEANILISKLEVNIVTEALEVAANCIKLVDTAIAPGKKNKIKLTLKHLSLSTGYYYANIVLYGQGNSLVLHNANQLQFSVNSRSTMWGCHYQPVVNIVVDNPIPYG